MPLVLVENERTASEPYEHWKDVTGEQYHFPNQYRNRIVPGTSFVYYRGTRRADGGRGIPEYFGCGLIGQVWRDQDIAESEPKRSWAWFSQIIDYVPFKTTVPAKLGNEFIEQIPQNFWGVGVRQLPAETYERILRLAGIPIIPTVITANILPAINEVVIPTTTANPLMIPEVPATSREAGVRRSTATYSRNAKMVGDRAEEIVLRYLRSQLAEIGGTLRWVARDGKTPGWDIEYVDTDGETVAVEVKGTAAAAFTSIELTDGEWTAARKLRSRYRLFLVAECLSVKPKVQEVPDAATLAERGDLAVSPVRWRVVRLSSETEQSGLGEISSSADMSPGQDQ
jgi:hypothetical protein